MFDFKLAIILSQEGVYTKIYTKSVSMGVDTEVRKGQKGLASLIHS